jgi:hypothetical protein
MDSITEFFKNFGPWMISGLSLVTGVVSIYISVKKTPHEIEKMDSDAVKTSSEATRSSAETVRIYADEIARLKAAHNKEVADLEQKNQDEIDRISKKVDGLSTEVIELKTAQSESNEYVRGLLRGIERLIGQIKMTGQIPVWEPEQPPESIRVIKNKKGSVL